MVATSTSHGHHNSGAFERSDRRVALVLGGNYRALGVVRALGRRGIPVWVVKQDGHALAGLSRYAERTLPWPKGDDARKIAYLEALASRSDVERFLLIPTDDECTALISRNHDVLANKFVLTTPPWASLRWALDKRLMYQLGERLGIDQPRTFFPDSVQGLTSCDVNFPVILKPATRELLNPLTTDKAWQVDDRRTLVSRYAEACSLMSPDLIMVQELIPGGGESQYSYAALCMEGRPLASLMALRARQFPRDFGRFSTFVETVDEPAIEVPATKLLEAIRFTGLVEVEFKRDRRDDRYKLLDINPRVWGWHSLCAAAGIDFSYLLWQLMRRQSLPKLHVRSGVRWARMGSDFAVASSEICRGELSIFEYLWGLRPPLETAIFALDDPVPAICELPTLVYLLCKRALMRLSSKQNTILERMPTPENLDDEQ